MEWFTFDQGVILGQSIMLVVSGWFMNDALRFMKRQNKVLDSAIANAKGMLAFIYYQKGIIVALQSGVIGPWNLGPVDLRNLPIELRMRLLHALIDVGVQVHLKKEDSDAHKGQIGRSAD